MKRPGFNLSWKLFLVVFLTSLLAILVMSTAMRLGFQEGFLNFLSELELRRLGQLENVLEQAYQAEGGWTFLQRDSRNWRIFLARYMQAEELRNRMNPYSAPPPSPNLLARLAVLDAERRIVAGEPSAQTEAVLRPLRIEDTVVGYLAVAPVESVTEAAEVTFLQQQLRVLLVSAAVTAAFAALAAMWLTRLFVRPIRIATRSVQQLAGGRYDLHLPESQRDDIGRLYGDINHLATTLANNERLRHEYASDIAHELRTPLAILRGELEAIEDGVRPMNAATLESLRGELTQLSTLVDDLHQLQLADTGSLKYRKEPVDLIEIIEEERARFAERYATANIRVDAAANAPRVMLDADAGQLSHLFSNLFENTLRYTDAGGRLEISVHANDVIEVDFMDTAPGVAEADLPRLLERMFRAEASRNRVSGGHGLGLAICQKIVAGHRGTMEARHSPLGGVWMHMRFPRDASLETTDDMNSEETP